MLIVEVKKGQLRRIISLQYSTLEGTARGTYMHACRVTVIPLSKLLYSWYGSLYH